MNKFAKNMSSLKTLSISVLTFLLGLTAYADQLTVSGNIRGYYDADSNAITPPSEFITLFGDPSTDTGTTYTVVIDIDPATIGTNSNTGINYVNAIDSYSFSNADGSYTYAFSNEADLDEELVVGEAVLTENPSGVTTVVAAVSETTASEASVFYQAPTKLRLSSWSFIPNGTLTTSQDTIAGYVIDRNLSQPRSILFYNPNPVIEPTSPIPSVTTLAEGLSGAGSSTFAISYINKQGKIITVAGKISSVVSETKTQSGESGTCKKPCTTACPKCNKSEEACTTDCKKDSKCNKSEEACTTDCKKDSKCNKSEEACTTDCKKDSKCNKSEKAYTTACCDKDDCDKDDNKSQKAYTTACCDKDDCDKDDNKSQKAV